MKQIDSKIKVNTLVKINGLEGFHSVEQINENRTLIKIKDFVGYFQHGHISQFTNSFLNN